VIVERGHERVGFVGGEVAWVFLGGHGWSPLCGRISLRYLGRAGIAWIT
jgi:hypothetical protein